MIGGTSGSETKFCQPDASQSKSTQTRSFSLGSRNTVERLETCCFRFSAPLVEKVFFRKRSKSSTSSLPKSFLSSLLGKVGRGPARCLAETALAVVDGRR